MSNCENVNNGQTVDLGKAILIGAGCVLAPRKMAAGWRNGNVLHVKMLASDM